MNQAKETEPKGKAGPGVNARATLRDVLATDIDFAFGLAGGGNHGDPPDYLYIVLRYK
jgi:hypothetical protein